MHYKNNIAIVSSILTSKSSSTLSTTRTVRQVEQDLTLIGKYYTHSPALKSLGIESSEGNIFSCLTQYMVWS